MLHAMIWLTAGTVIGLIAAHGWIPLEQTLVDITSSLKEIMWQIQSYIS